MIIAASWLYFPVTLHGARAGHRDKNPSSPEDERVVNKPLEHLAPGATRTQQEGRAVPGAGQGRWAGSGPFRLLRRLSLHSLPKISPPMNSVLLLAQQSQVTCPAGGGLVCGMSG